MATLDELFGLPNVQFAELDTAKIEANIIKVYEGIQNTTLFPGDPVRLFLSTLAAVIGQLYVTIDYTGKQNLMIWVLSRRFLTDDILKAVSKYAILKPLIFEISTLLLKEPP